MSKKIKIEWLSDSYDCDTCGTSYATGARVYRNDKLILNLLPTAHCYGGSDYSEEDVYKAIMESLNYSIEEEYVDS